MHGVPRVLPGSPSAEPAESAERMSLIVWGARVAWALGDEILGLELLGWRWAEKNMEKGARAGRLREVDSHHHDIFRPSGTSKLQTSPESLLWSRSAQPFDRGRAAMGSSSNAFFAQNTSFRPSGDLESLYSGDSWGSACASCQLLVPPKGPKILEPVVVVELGGLRTFEVVSILQRKWC